MALAHGAQPRMLMASQGHNLSLVMDQHIPWYGILTAGRTQIAVDRRTLFYGWIGRPGAQLDASRCPTMISSRDIFEATASRNLA